MRCVRPLLTARAIRRRFNLTGSVKRRTCRLAQRAIRAARNSLNSPCFAPLRMRLYVDDDLAQPLLAQLLRKAGHDVVFPIALGLSGREDPVHLRHAIGQARVFLSGNHEDFEQLHDLVLEAQGHHPGILIVRRDNNPKRSGPRGIVRALGNLIAANLSLDDQFLVLNNWR